MAWTAPRTWVNLEVVSHTLMNTHVRDNLQYLKDVLDGVQTQTILPSYAAADALGQSIVFQKGRGTLGAPTIVSAGDNLGNIYFRGHDGSAYRDAALIRAVVAATPGANDMPGALGFYTTPDGSVAPTLRLSIERDGSFFQTAGVGYFGDFDSGGTSYPRAGTDLAINRDWVNGEMVYWNTNTAGGILSHSFRQLTGASSSVELMRLSTTEGVMALGGNASGDGFGFINDADTLITNGSANNLTFVVGNNGRVLINDSLTQYGQTTAWLYTSGAAVAAVMGSATPMVVDRQTNDGTLISLRQDATEEGTISVSTTTVAYNTFFACHYAQFDRPDLVPPVGGIVVATGEIIASENRWYVEDLIEVIDGRPVIVGTRRHPRREGPGSEFWRVEDMPAKDYLPKVAGTTTPNDPRAYGVYFALLTEDAAGSSFGKSGLPVHQIGGVGLWKCRVTDTGGDIQVGDYITTSSRRYEGQRQVEAQLCAWTVAKALVNVTWADVPVDPALGYKWRLIPATLHAS